MEKTDNFLERVLVITIIILVIVLFGRECGHKQALADRDAVNAAITDSLRISRNSLGQSTGTTSVITDTDSEYFLSLRSKDSTIVKLQKLVEKYKSQIGKSGGSITIINSEGTVDLTVPTEIDNSNSEKPTYNSRFSLLDSSGKSWGGGTVVAKPDSTSVKLKYREEIDVLIGIEKTGFLGLGKGKSFATVTFHNPFSEVQEMKVYQTKSPAKNYWHVGPVITLGVDTDLKPQLVGGIGVMWTPFNF